MLKQWTSFASSSAVFADNPCCESFYALPRFQTIWLWNRGGRTIPLGAGLAVDAVGSRIVAVEVVRNCNET